MKRLLTLLIPLALACGGGEPGPAPDPTPAPEPTIAAKPCSTTGLMAGDKKVYEGDCEVSASCKDGKDGFFYGECASR